MPVPGLGQEKSLRRISKEILGEIAASDYDDELQAIEISSPLSLEAKSTAATLNNAIDNDRAPNLNQAAPHGMDEFSEYENKIVCTMMNELYGQEPAMNKIWVDYGASMRNSKIYTLGYHTLFVPLVNFAKKPGRVNYIVRKVLEDIAVNRTSDILAEKYKQTRFTRGRLYRLLLEPLCFIVGYIKNKGI